MLVNRSIVRCCSSCDCVDFSEFARGLLFCVKDGDLMAMFILITICSQFFLECVIYLG
jgi:hypothetical protein